MSRPIPQGIEVLVLKAAVDPDFKQILLQQRAAAAESIGLELTVGEAAMLAAVPASQLEAIIARASVPHEHRLAFLGQAAATMLAALGAVRSAVADEPAHPNPNPAGIAPPAPMPPSKTKTLEERVIEIISDRMGLEAKNVKRGDALVRDLKAKAADLDQIRKDLEKEFDIQIPAADFKTFRFVGTVVARVERAVKSKPPPPSRPPAPSPGPPAAGFGGIRPN